jgi:hypothetical protein
LAIAQALAGDIESARGSVTQLLKLDPQFTVEEFLRRSPSSQFTVGKQYAEALQRAGLPYSQ